jgi:glycosyltransferase involved in cell wall biosynthesis
VSNSVRVSVVMPLHNAEAYVEAAVRSALASDILDLEVIVVDDGSRDRSAAVVSAIDDPRVELVRITASGGPSRPRNVGIATARASYIAFVDSDDLLKRDKLAAAVQALERCPAASFAFADFESIDERGALIKQSVLGDYLVWPMLTSEPAHMTWRTIPQVKLARALVYENFIGTSGVVVRKATLDALGGFDESLPYSEDRDLWFRLVHHGDALFSTRVGHSYRVRPGSLTDGPRVRNARARIAVLQREKKRWSEDERTIHRQLDRLIASNLGVIGYEERRSRPLHAMLMFARAFATSPQIRWLRGLLGSVVR